MIRTAAKVYDCAMPKTFLLALMMAFTGAGAQLPPVGIIDLYGLRSVPEQQVRDALQFREGDSFPASKAEVERRLGAIPGVVRARISGVCCAAGKSIMFIGIEERGTPVPRFRTAPAGQVRLPADVVEAGAAFTAAVSAAVLRGNAGDDPTRGYSLLQDSAARAIQERFIAFAARDAAVLRDVLQNSSTPPTAHSRRRSSRTAPIAMPPSAISPRRSWIRRPRCATTPCAPSRCSRCTRASIRTRG